MANIAVTISVIFSLFFLSHAHIPLTLTDAPVTEQIDDSAMPENGQNPLLLPSEKPKTETMTMTGLPTMEADSGSDSISVVRILRPVNRHFGHMPGKRPFGFPFPHRCHHHHHQQVRGPHVMRTPYGDDMIQVQEFNGHKHQIPASFPGVNHRFPVRPVQMNGGSFRDEVETNMPEFPSSEEEKTEREHRRPFFRTSVFRMNGGSLKDDDVVEMPLFFETRAEGFGHRFPVRSVGMNGGMRGNRAEFDEREGKEERREGGFIKWFQDLVNHF